MCHLKTKVQEDLMDKANEFEILEFMMRNFKHSVGVELADAPESPLVDTQTEGTEIDNDNQKVNILKYFLCTVFSM